MSTLNPHNHPARSELLFQLLHMRKLRHGKTCKIDLGFKPRMPSSSPPLLMLHGAASVHHFRPDKLFHTSCTCAPLSVTLFSHPWIASLHPLGVSWDVTSSGEIFPELTTPTISLSHSPSLIAITTLCCFPHSFSYHYQHKFSFLSFGIFISLVQKYLLSSLPDSSLFGGLSVPIPWTSSLAMWLLWAKGCALRKIARAIVCHHSCSPPQQDRKSLCCSKSLGLEAICYWGITAGWLTHVIQDVYLFNTLPISWNQRLYLFYFILFTQHLAKGLAHWRT